MLKFFFSQFKKTSLLQHFFLQAGSTVKKLGQTNQCCELIKMGMEGVSLQLYIPDYPMHNFKVDLGVILFHTVFLFHKHFFLD